MAKHQFELEELEDKVGEAALAARFEAKGRRRVELAADAADAVRISLSDLPPN